MTYNFRILTCAALLAILAWCVTADGAEFVPPPLPPVTLNMTPDEFQTWATQQNELALGIAQKRARPGKVVTSVQDTSSTVISGGTVYSDYGYGLPYVGTYQQTPTFSNTTRGTYSRTFELSPYGGGPLYIINPYCPPRIR